MNFRRDAPAALIGSAVLVIAGMALASSALFSGLTASIEASQFDLMRSIVRFNLKGAEDRALARAEMIAALPSIVDIFAARDRPRLLAECAAMFAVQKEKYGVDQAQFHIPPAVSFLRLQAPEQFGDDLSKFRPIVVQVNRSQAPSKGIAIARSGPAVFGVTPVRGRDGSHLGSFEIGIDFGPMLDGLKAAYGLELALLVEEEPMREFAKGVKPEVFVDANRVGKYVKFHSTNWTLMKGLATSQDVAATDEAQYTREASGLPYGVLLLPLKNGAGQTIAILAVARDFGGSRAAAGRSRVWQGLLALLAVVLLAGVALVVVRGFLLRPLGVIAARLDARATGAPEPPLPEGEVLCDELQALAAACERVGHAERPPDRGGVA